MLVKVIGKVFPLQARCGATLEGGEWSAARPSSSLPPGNIRYPFYRRLSGPQGRSGRAENLFPTRIRSRTVQPALSSYTCWVIWPTLCEGRKSRPHRDSILDRPGRSQSLYRLSYRVHNIMLVIVETVKENNENIFRIVENLLCCPSKFQRKGKGSCRKLWNWIFLSVLQDLLLGRSQANRNHEDKHTQDLMCGWPCIVVQCGIRNQLVVT